jgi:hypothetical protein
MADADTSTETGRGGDRRGNDRRRLERRTPPPVWRRPWAFAGYGAVGAAVLLYLLTGSGREGGGDPPIVERTPAIAAPQAAPPAAASDAPVEDASGGSGYERLTLQGPAAEGRRVRAELYCEPAGSFQVRVGVQPEAAVAALAAEGRVPAATCKWGDPADPRRGDLVLLVPPELADDFASAPVVTDQFQRRRRVSAVVEWIGRSEALALRHAGVLRAVRR